MLFLLGWSIRDKRVMLYFELVPRRLTMQASRNTKMLGVLLQLLLNRYHVLCLSFSCIALFNFY